MFARSLCLCLLSFVLLAASTLTVKTIGVPLDSRADDGTGPSKKVVTKRARVSSGSTRRSAAT